MTTTFLLADARENDHLFDLYNREGCFPRLVELIAQPHLRQREQHVHRQLMELLYEMSRIQRITNDDLSECAHRKLRVSMGPVTDWK